MNDKKITLGIITPYPPSKTTLNEYGYHLTKHFQEKNEVSAIQLYTEELNHDEQYSVGDKLDFVPCWTFNSYQNLLTIIKAVRQKKPDIVILNLQFLIFGDKKIPAALGLLLPSILRLAGFKNIVLLHNILEEVDLKKAGITENPILTFLYSLIGNLLTRMILMSNLVGVTIEKYVDVLRAKYKKKNIVLLPHGAFEVPPTPSYTLPEGVLKVMTFGKFGTYKKVEILIDAIEIIRSRTNLDIEIVVAGTDNPNVKGYLADVKARYNHVEQLTFTGYVAEEDVAGLFINSAVTVFPYTSTTGSSGVLHQAGSYGKAAILPKLGDLALLVEEEGYEGVFFDPENANSLADAIQVTLTDETKRKNIEKANFQAASSLSLADIADWYLIHIDKLLKDI